MNIAVSNKLLSQAKWTVFIRVIIGALAGLIAGLLYGVLLNSQHMSPLMNAVDIPGDQLTHLLLSILVGVGFGFAFGERATTAGTSFLWGIVAGLIWWLLGPLTLFPLMHGIRPDWAITSARQAFPLLVGLAVAYGAFMGLLYSGFYWFYQNRTTPHLARQILLRLVQALVSGGIAGLLGGVVFGGWMAQAGFYPLVAGLVNSNDPVTGQWLHLLISVLIGSSYGLLFRHDISRTGSSIAWGVVYGLVWWILGPLTLMPWLLGQGVQWTITAAQNVFPSLIGHVIYGVVLGMTYATLNQIWRTLFVDSDPLTREPEGPGTRTLRSLGLGAVASVAGGLVFTIVMVATDTLPKVANIIGMTTPLEGFVVHMVISILIGASYGLLFRREATTPTLAFGWGLVYGLVWWFLGPLTLFPLLLGQPIQWSLDAALQVYPSLIGHLAYGVVLALGYYWLLRRYDIGRMLPKSDLMSDQASSSAYPALSFLVLLLTLFLLLILAH
ncbi:MAG: hypothetical protein H0X30_12870 [Anaerolineae bacterium]|nr:hypothetical protein [Anaerolineae bacterium]